MSGREAILVIGLATLAIGVVIDSAVLSFVGGFLVGFVGSRVAAKRWMAS